MEMSSLEHMRREIEPLRQALLEHPLYARMETVADVRVFMEHHVFAVWDFMSLLKALQRRLCSVDVPWIPARDPRACRFINEIVLGEESDADGAGGFASHFELYRSAMQECGARTAGIDDLVSAVRRGIPVRTALDTGGAPVPARQFVDQTFRIIESGDVAAIASAFTFGREDLLPDVFRRLVDRLHAESPGTLQRFRYYLERHIDLDGDEHGPLAEQLVAGCCGDDPERWRTAAQAARESLAARLVLWNGIAAALPGAPSMAVTSGSRTGSSAP